MLTLFKLSLTKSVYLDNDLTCKSPLLAKELQPPFMIVSSLMSAGIEVSSGQSLHIAFVDVHIGQALLAGQVDDTDMSGMKNTHNIATKK